MDLAEKRKWISLRNTYSFFEFEETLENNEMTKEQFFEDTDFTKYGVDFISCISSFYEDFPEVKLTDKQIFSLLHSPDIFKACHFKRMNQLQVLKCLERYTFRMVVEILKCDFFDNKDFVDAVNYNIFLNELVLDALEMPRHQYVFERIIAHQMNQYVSPNFFTKVILKYLNNGGDVRKIRTHNVYLSEEELLSLPKDLYICFVRNCRLKRETADKLVSENPELFSRIVDQCSEDTILKYVGDEYIDIYLNNYNTDFVKKLIQSKISDRNLTHLLRRSGCYSQEIADMLFQRNSSFVKVMSQECIRKEWSLQIAKENPDCWKSIPNIISDEILTILCKDKQISKELPDYIFSYSDLEDLDSLSVETMKLLLEANPSFVKLFKFQEFMISYVLGKRICDFEHENKSESESE